MEELTSNFLVSHILIASIKELMEELFMKSVFNFFWWFVAFGLSFLVASLGWTEQGKAFLFIELGGTILITLVLILLLLILSNSIFEKIGITFLSIFVIPFEIALALLATWVATKLFDVDFFVAYQIMSFGQCLCVSHSRKKKED